MMIAILTTSSINACLLVDYDDYDDDDDDNLTCTCTCGCRARCSSRTLVAPLFVQSVLERIG